VTIGTVDLSAENAIVAAVIALLPSIALLLPWLSRRWRYRRRWLQAAEMLAAVPPGGSKDLREVLNETIELTSAQLHKMERRWVERQKRIPASNLARVSLTYLATMSVLAFIAGLFGDQISAWFGLPLNWYGVAVWLVGAVLVLVGGGYIALQTLTRPSGKVEPAGTSDRKD
jgi:hypothetical protein